MSNPLGYYNESGREKRSLLRTVFALVIAALFTLALFSLLALTQKSDASEASSITARPVRVATPPPPPPPPVEQEQQEEKARMLQGVSTTDATPQKMELNPLVVSLDARPSGNMKELLAVQNFSVQANAVAAIESFAIGELDKVPSLLNSPPVNYPLKLLRMGITGKVELLVSIDETGQVQVKDVHSTSHTEFTTPAIEMAEKMRYEPPTVNGETVRTKDFILPIPFTIN